MKDMQDCEWLQQWTDLAKRFAFQYNPALQPRAIIVYGCISKSVTDSELKQLLRILVKVSDDHWTWQSCNKPSVYLNLSRVAENCNENWLCQGICLIFFIVANYIHFCLISWSHVLLFLFPPGSGVVYRSDIDRSHSNVPHTVTTSPQTGQ